MATFRTPYDTLLRVRRIEEDTAKAALAAANHARREAQARLQAGLGHYGDARHLPDGETGVAAFLGRLAHARSAAQEVQLAGSAVEQADGARAEALEGVREASMRSQGLERLVERAQEAHLHEMLAADQRAAEESMSGTWRTRPKGAR